MNKYQMALNRMVCHICNSRNGIYVRDGKASEDMHTLQELIDKYEKAKYPRFVPCKCGKNRRYGIYNCENGWKNKTITYECMSCGTKVTTKGSEADAIRHWNEVMSN